MVVSEELAQGDAQHFSALVEHGFYYAPEKTLIVGSKEDYERMQANRKNVLDFVTEGVLVDEN